MSIRKHGVYWINENWFATGTAQAQAGAEVQVQTHGHQQGYLSMQDG